MLLVMVYLILSTIVICGITILTLVTQSRGRGLVFRFVVIFIVIWKRRYALVVICVWIITLMRLRYYDIHCRNIPSVVTWNIQVISVWKPDKDYLVSQWGHQWIYSSSEALKPWDRLLIYGSTQAINYCITVHTHRYVWWKKITHRIRGWLFDYNLWLSMKWIDWFIKGVWIRQTNNYQLSYTSTIREQLLTTITTLFHHQRSIWWVWWSLIGDKSTIEKSDYELLINSWLVHLIVVSGWNLALVTIILWAILFRLPIHVRYFLISLWLVLYVSIVWFDSSIIRALIMALITIMWTMIWRKRSFRAMICITIILLLRYSPLMIYDIWLWLSLGAVIGIYLTYQWVNRMTIQRTQKRYIKQSRQILLIISASIGAWLWTLPILIWQFGSANLTSIVANSITGIIASITTIAELTTIGLYSIVPHFIWVQWMVQATNYLVWLIYRIAKLTVEWWVWIWVWGQSGFWIIGWSIMVIFVLLYRHTHRMRIEYLLEIEE